MILSIDQSTSATKAMLWGLDGRALTRADVAHRQITNAQGHIEHDPMEILNNTYKAAKRAITAAGVEPSAVDVIAISNQRETAVCWDKVTGEPLHNAIVWQCARATDIVNSVRAAGLEGEVQGRTGLALSPYFSAAKFGWMVRHVQGVADAMKLNRLCCGTIDSWLVFKLTGAFKTDLSNASRTQLFDLQGLAWDEGLIEAFGLTPACMPEPCMSDSLFGMTDLGGILPRRIPIHAVMGDSHAALFGNQCFEPSMAKATYGTGASVMMNVGAALIKPASGVSASLAWGINGKAEYVLEGNINYAGAVMQWLMEDVGMLNDIAGGGEVARSVSDTGGVYLVPAFSGLGAPYFNSGARAAWLGMNRGTNKAHLIRAAMESIAYQVRDVIEAINQCAPQPITTLRADGGATKDGFLMEFQAGMLGMDIEVSHTEELSSMGAAFCAAIGAGLTSRDIFTGQGRRRVKASMDEQTRNRLYAGWQDSVKILTGG